jgi:hypothetical protein
MVKAKRPRIGARDLSRQVKKLTGSDNRVTWQRLFLDP